MLAAFKPPKRFILAQILNLSKMKNILVLLAINSFIAFSQMSTTILPGGKMRPTTSPLDEPIHIFSDSTAFIFTSFASSYYYGCVDGKCGYVNEVYLIVTDEMRIYSKNILDSIELASDNRSKEIDSLYHLRLRQSWGDDEYYMVMAGKYWIGMSVLQAEMAIGKPDEINKTTTSKKSVTHFIDKSFSGGKLPSCIIRYISTLYQLSNWLSQTLWDSSI